MLTKLQAVNEMLAAIPEAPVASLTGALHEDAATAITTLDRVSEDVQRMGWTFNTETDVEIVLDADDHATLTEDVLKIQVDLTKVKAGVEVVPRGTRLYDRKNNVYTFDENIWLKKLIRLLDWEDLPDTARRYICQRATRIYVAQITKSQPTTQHAGLEEAMSLRELRREHGMNPKPNVLRSPGISSVFGWRQERL